VGIVWLDSFACGGGDGSPEAFFPRPGWGFHLLLLLLLAHVRIANEADMGQQQLLLHIG